MKSGKKNKMKANKITTNELKKNYDVLYKGPFSHIMPKARKTLGTAMLLYGYYLWMRRNVQFYAYDNSFGLLQKLCKFS